MHENVRILDCPIRWLFQEEVNRIVTDDDRFRPIMYGECKVHDNIGHCIIFLKRRGYEHTTKIPCMLQRLD